MSNLRSYFSLLLMHIARRFYRAIAPLFFFCSIIFRLSALAQLRKGVTMKAPWCTVCRSICEELAENGTALGKKIVPKAQGDIRL